MHLINKGKSLHIGTKDRNDALTLCPTEKGLEGFYRLWGEVGLGSFVH